MRYFFAVVRFIVTGIVALLLGCCLRAALWAQVHQAHVPMTASIRKKHQVHSRSQTSGSPHGRRPDKPREMVGDFRDPELNKLEEQIAASNQSLKVAEARFREARAAIRFNRLRNSDHLHCAER